jgi:signal recognition particle subunit SEC65
MLQNTDFVRAISLLTSGESVEYTHNDGKIELWDLSNKGVPEPSEEEIQDKIDDLKAGYDALQWERDRAKDYPSMADQLDYIYHNGIAKWKSDIIKPVKDAHPKP